MRVYVDSSAALKRVVREPRSAELIETLHTHHEAGDTLHSSVLAWVEVSRALHSRAGRHRLDTISRLVDDATTGVIDEPINAEVIAIARRIPPPGLRSLDAIHLATALITGADLVLTYDVRLAEACRSTGLPATAP